MVAIQPKHEVDNQQEREEVQTQVQGTELEHTQYSTGEAPLTPADSNPGSKIQMKLAIGQPNDRYEQEADHIADQVMQMPALSIQRMCRECKDELQRQPMAEEEKKKEEETLQTKPLAESITPLIQRQTEPTEEEEKKKEETLQTKTASDEPPTVSPALQNQITALQGGGQPLPESERRFFEPRFGADFSQVRIHTDKQAAETARAVNARAFTLGQNTVFGAGQYQSSASERQWLLAHELTHVVQQISPQLQNVGATVNSGSKRNIQSPIPVTNLVSPAIIQLSPLSEELEQVWNREGKGVFFERLRHVQVTDPDVLTFIETNLVGDDLWLAKNIFLYGTETNWPIHLRVEREMKGWADSHGKGAVFDILRTANGAEASNAQLTASISGVFAAGSDDLWLAQNLQAYGTETNWPIHLRVEREMKGWPDSGGQAEVFNILRNANGLEASNSRLTALLNRIFAADSEDLWYAQNLQIYGDESHWPSEAQEHWRNARTARTAAPGRTHPGTHWPAGGAPRELLVGTRTPTPAERAAITQSLTPVRGVPTFQPHHPVHGNYETRIRDFLRQWINRRYRDDVMGRGRTEHANPTKLHPMSRFEEIGNAAKQQVDAVFGSYALGPVFVGGTNLLDQWQTYDDEVWGIPDPTDPTGVRRIGGLSNADRIDKARDLISYVLSADESVRTINDQHGAVMDRTTPPPSGGDAEATILDRIRNHFATTQTNRLLQIERAWPATASGGIVNIQLWRASTDEGNRRIFWDAFQTMIHEYLHTLAHPDYVRYYDRSRGGRYAYGSDEYNTLEEGVDSLLTETVWANVSGRVSDPALRQKVEGATYASQPFNPNVIPSIEEQRYPSYAQARNLVRIVGINNLYAAYFLGEVDLIRGT